MRRHPLEFLVPVAIPHPKVRFGRERDGGYVLVDHMLADIGALYSYGIGRETSFDNDFTERVRCPVFQYDHTISESPSTGELFHFKKQGVAGVKTHCHDTIAAHISENGHADSRNLILKMDVEGWEWGVFDKLAFSTLGQFRQMVIEFHRMTEEDRIEAVFSKLSSLFCIAHLHGNNFGRQPGGMPETLEVSFIRTDLILPIDRTQYPVAGIDFPNNPNSKDIPLGWWQA